MEILQNILLVVHIIVCILLTAAVLLQSGNSSGLSGTISGGADTFFGQNKGKTLDAVLGKITAILAILLLAITIALTVTINTISRNEAAEAAAQQIETEATVEGEAVPVEGEEVPVEVTEEAPVEEVEVEAEVEAEAEAETEEVPAE